MSYGGPERRRTPRLALALPAQLRERGNSAESVQLVDLSAHGCRIETAVELSAGSFVWLKLPGLETIWCRVMWSRPAFAGLEFDVPLHEAVVERLASEGGGAPDSRLATLEALSRRCRFLASRPLPGGEEGPDPLVTLAQECEAAAAEISGDNMGKRSV